jgi:hypothetical protein
VQVGSIVQETRFIYRASAFQLLNLPVWGVQFHPNWPVDGAETVFRIIKLHNPSSVVERQGTVDEDERRHIARAFVSACHHHVVLKRD